MQGEHWTATRNGDGPAIPIGAVVRVESVQGLRLYVEPAPDETWVADPLKPATPSSDDVLPITGGVRYITPPDPAGGARSS